MKGVGEKGTEDGALSRVRGQGRGLRGGEESRRSVPWIWEFRRRRLWKDKPMAWQGLWPA